MIASPRLKIGDSIRIGTGTYSVRAQWLYDAPLTRWYEWTVYDAVNAVELRLAQIGDRLHTSTRAEFAADLPPTPETLGNAALTPKADGQVRLETAGTAGTHFARGRFWRFGAPDGVVTTVTQFGDEVQSLLATPLDETQIEIYRA